MLMASKMSRKKLGKGIIMNMSTATTAMPNRISTRC